MADTTWHQPPAEDRAAAETAVLQMAQLVYRHTFTSPEEVAAYMRAIGDLSVAEILAGCDRCAREERFFPRPAVLRQHALAHRSSGDGYGADMHRASRGARYWQDERGQTHVEYRCWQCQDEGFAVVLCTPDGASTGEVIALEELRRRERESSARVHYRRKRCACRMGGAA